MIPLTHHTDSDFEARFRDRLAARSDTLDVRESVDTIVRDVRTRGDAALIDLTERFDKHTLSVDTLALSADAVERAISDVSEEVRDAIDLAHARIFSHHEKMRPDDFSYTDSHGNVLGWRWSQIDSVGLYVPGGTASYPSSVLMNGVPARVAGVKRIVAVVPAPYGRVNGAVLYAAKKLAIDEIYLIGGAQAVAALAYGTQRIQAVDKIVGPGNAFVAEAKRQVFGTVGIDMIAGPSEVCIIADESAPAHYIAADMMAQAEHDTRAQSILITPSQALGKKVVASLKELSQSLPRAEIIAASLQNHGGIFVTRDLDHAAVLANEMAAEHVELMVEDPEALGAQIRHAGAVFMGTMTPEAIGDYNGGSNHVLPTGRSARFSSGLSVTDFMKRTSVLQLSEAGMSALGADAIALAKAEALDAHALSVQVRLDDLQG